MKIYDVTRWIDEETPVWPGDVAFSWREVSSPGDGHRLGLDLLHDERARRHARRRAEPRVRRRQDDRAGAPLGLPRAGTGGGPAGSRRGRARRPSEEGPRGGARSLSERGQGFAVSARRPAARARGAVLVGTDAPSIDPEDAEDLPAHRALLGSGVALLEDLDLAAVPEGVYQLVALPLRFADLDASPVRAILIAE